MKPWRFHEEVPAEIERTARWYEGERSGLGTEFLTVLQEVVACLEDGSVVSSPAREDRRARRVLLLRFPFAIVFVETEDAFVIVAVAHHKRQPGYWASRLAPR
jgi:hypothetical protein